MSGSGDRRPIAARSLPAAVAVAGWLARQGASPNAISVAGAVAACAAGAAFACVPAAGNGAWALWLAGAVLVQLRLLANMLDGMVAIGRGVASPVGELFNEVPDRVSDSAVLVGLGVAAGDPALGLLAALLAMATAYVRAVGKAAGAGSEFCGPMAKQQRMALVTAQAVVAGVVPGLWRPGYGQAVLWVIAGLSALTAVRRLMRVAAALR